MTKKKRQSAGQYVRSVAKSFEGGNGNGQQRRASDSHKGIRWSLLASIAVCLSVVGPYVSTFLGGYEKAEHAREQIVAIYQVIGTIARTQAWSSVSAIKTEKTVAENRATDCDIKIANGEHLSVMEMQACAKWKSDAVDASRRYDKAYDDASKIGKPTTNAPPEEKAP